MKLGPWVAAALLGAVATAGSASTAVAAEPVATVLTLAADPVYADTATTLAIELRDAGDLPVGGAEVVVERRTGDTWAVIAELAIDETGHASHDVVLARVAEDNVFRASYAGDASYAPSSTGPVQVALVRRHSTLTITGPARVVDETEVVLTVTWRTGNGIPVEGPVTVSRRREGEEWKEYRTVATAPDGTLTLTLRPRVDTWWRVRGHWADWVEGARSAVHALDNVPPGVPVTLPAKAPKPVPLPAQPHAKGAGANPVITTIPDAVWEEMKGRSWHRGCPVGRASLRFLRINYWDFDGYRRRGELVAHQDGIQAMADALSAMYDELLPLRSLYRVDRFGWSQRLHGADNYASMASDNSSAFNCRSVVGKPGTRSPHASGFALDLNPWENPYQSAKGTVPDTWWLTRSHARVAWRSAKHAVVAIMRDHGLAWTYGTRDSQHFDVRH